MAINLGLRRAELRDYRKLLQEPHWVIIKLQVLDLEDKHLSDISTYFLGGQVDIDTSAEITRTCQLELLDPEAKLNFDTESPHDGALFLDRQMKVTYTVASPDFQRVYSVPLFHGPMTKVERDHDVLQVEASGKELLALAQAWKSSSYRKGVRRTYIIEHTLRRRAGEGRLSIRNSNKRLPKEYSTSRTALPWKVSKRQANILNQHLFYDGRGFARLRIIPGKTVYVFRRSVIKSHPQTGYDLSSLKNVIRVKGKAKSKGKGKNKKERAIHVTVTARRSHPLSPWRLGRRGVPMRLVEELEDDGIRTRREARRRGRRLLNQRLLEGLDVAFDCLPVPDLEENDVLRVSTGEFAAQFRLKKMSIPLTVDGSSSIGYNRKLTPSRTRIRRK